MLNPPADWPLAPDLVEAPISRHDRRVVPAENSALRFPAHIRPKPANQPVSQLAGSPNDVAATPFPEKFVPADARRIQDGLNDGLGRLLVCGRGGLDDDRARLWSGLAGAEIRRPLTQYASADRRRCLRQHGLALLLQAAGVVDAVEVHLGPHVVEVGIKPRRAYGRRLKRAIANFSSLPSASHFLYVLLGTQNAPARRGVSRQFPLLDGVTCFGPVAHARTLAVPVRRTGVTTSCQLLMAYSRSSASE